MLRYPTIRLGGTAAEPTLKITKERDAMTPDVFRIRRLILELNQKELASVMGYASQPAISRIERGSVVPPLADRLIRAYGWGYRPRDWPPGKHPAGK